MANMLGSRFRVQGENIGLVAWLEEKRVRLPLKGVEVGFTVRAGTADVEVVQIFHQDNQKPLDCQYLFPLPAESAVYQCEININGRPIAAKVEERSEAVRQAQEQKAAGRRTALVESERDNLFTLSLGNVQPSDLVVVRLRYVQPLRRLNHQFSLEIPTGPGIRYIPGRPLIRSNRGRGVVDDTDQVPDASRITPPRIDQFHPDAAYLSLSGRIDAGLVDPKSITSPSHRISAKAQGSELLVGLKTRGVVPDKDIVLRWAEKQAEKTTPAAWVYRRNGESFALLEIRAPEAAPDGPVQPLDAYFLVDRSGSMDGEKWRKAVEALQSCMGTLREQDRAMITFFESGHHDFAEAPLPVARIVADVAFKSLVNLEIGGGTELSPALTHVVELWRAHSNGRRAVVILITDAQVGDDDGILKVVAGARDLPVHCFGIDDALNDALLIALARQQGGSFHSLNPNDDIAAEVSRLGATLRHPALTELELSEGWETADGQIPGLHAGQVHYLAARSTTPGSPLFISARENGNAEKTALRFEPAEVAEPTPRLVWSRRRIQRLIIEGNGHDAVQLSKEANLVCRLTAFVAWDEQEKVQLAADHLVQPAVTLDALNLMMADSGRLRQKIVASKVSCYMSDPRLFEESTEHFARTCKNSKRIEQLRGFLLSEESANQAETEVGIQGRAEGMGGADSGIQEKIPTPAEGMKDPIERISRDLELKNLESKSATLGNDLRVLRERRDFLHMQTEEFPLHLAQLLNKLSAQASAVAGEIRSGRGDWDCIVGQLIEDFSGRLENLRREQARLRKEIDRVEKDLLAAMTRFETLAAEIKQMTRP